MTEHPMKMYTSTGTRELIRKCNAHNIGLLMVDVWRDPNRWPYFAVDNGCFAAWNRQEEWNPAPFLNILHRCKREGRRPDFIVIPDIPLSGESLAFSRLWMPVLSRQFPDFPHYLAVQDGMSPPDIEPLLGGIQGIFVGGSMDWKLETMPSWVKFSHTHGIQCHIGRIGPIRRMMMCELAGADSIDSTTWVQRRGGIDRYIGGYKAQTRLEEHTGGSEGGGENDGRMGM